MSPDSIANTIPTTTPPPTVPVVPSSPQPPTKERKLLIVAVITAASLAVIALVAIITTIIALNSQGTTTPPVTPPPEPEIVAPKPSSKFATDAAILQIRQDAKTVLSKLDSLDFSEPEITPPSLDLRLNVPPQF